MSAEYKELSETDRAHLDELVGQDQDRYDREMVSYGRACFDAIAGWEAATQENFISAATDSTRSQTNMVATSNESQVALLCAAATSNKSRTALVHLGSAIVDVGLERLPGVEHFKSNTEMKACEIEPVKSNTTEVNLKPPEVVKSIMAEVSAAAISTESKNDVIDLDSKSNNDLEAALKRPACFDEAMNTPNTVSSKELALIQQSSKSAPKISRSIVRTASGIQAQPTVTVEKEPVARVGLSVRAAAELQEDTKLKKENKVAPPETVKSITSEVKLESPEPDDLQSLINARELLDRRIARAVAGSKVPDPVTSAFPEPVSSGGVSSSATKGGVVDLTSSDDDE